MLNAELAETAEKLGTLCVFRGVPR